jgi:hypothetical protein
LARFASRRPVPGEPVEEAWAQAVADADAEADALATVTSPPVIQVRNHAG